MLQKIINWLLLKVRFYVNDGRAHIQSKPGFLSVVTVNKGGDLHIGKGTSIQPYTFIRSGKKLVIGDEVMIAPHCYISDFQHDPRKKGMERHSTLELGECVIDDGAWVGAGCVIIRSKIGKNCIIGANSVLIDKEVEDNSIFIGDTRNPDNALEISY